LHCWLVYVVVMITQSYHEFCRKLAAQYHGVWGQNIVFFSDNVNVKLTSAGDSPHLGFYIFFLSEFSIFNLIDRDAIFF